MEHQGVTVCALPTSNNNIANHTKISKVRGVGNSIKKGNTIILLICKENGLVANKNSQKRICEYFDISEGVRA